MCTLKWLHPSFLKSQMWLVFMAVHSRYGHHYLKDILCSTDSWRGQGSEEFTLPHLLQDMGELVHINRGAVVFSYLLSKNGWEPNLESGRQEICDDLSSVRSGIVFLQSVAPGPMACRAHWMRGHAISSLQRRLVREPWMTCSSILPLRQIYTDPHRYWSTSKVINLPNSVSKMNSVSNEAFSEPKTVKQEIHLWRVSWTTIAWSRAHGMDTTLHGCSSLPESREFWLHAAFFGPNEIHATSPRSNVKSINIKM